MRKSKEDREREERPYGRYRPHGSIPFSIKERFVLAALIVGLYLVYLGVDALWHWLVRR